MFFFLFFSLIILLQIRNKITRRMTDIEYRVRSRRNYLDGLKRTDVYPHNSHSCVNEKIWKIRWKMSQRERISLSMYLAWKKYLFVCVLEKWLKQ